ncbi:hypothetical protein D3C71_744230 [compost metagenome]
MHHQFPLLAFERAAHRVQRILSVPHGAERGRYAGLELPPVCIHPLGQPHSIEPLQPCPQHVLTLPIGWIFRQVDAVRTGLPNKRPIQTGKPLLIHLA